MIRFIFFHTVIIFFITCNIVWPLQTSAMMSIKTTLSSGYYKDPSKNSHLTYYFNSELEHIHQSGVETYLDLGINNNFVLDELKAFPYQFYVTIPFDQGHEKAPQYKSRIQLGRQILVESFEMDVMDGIFLPYYFTPHIGASLFAGGLHVPEETRIDLDDRVYGASLFLKGNDGIIKLAPLSKTRRNAEEEHFLNLSVMKSWYWEKVSPTILFKEQWDLREATTDQQTAELQLSIGRFNIDFIYDFRSPSKITYEEREFIYRLFSMTKQRSLESVISWNILDNLQIAFRIGRTKFASNFIQERGETRGLSVNWTLDHAKFNTYLNRIYSYGGKLTNIGCFYEYNLNSYTDFQLEGDVAKFNKKNGIYGYAYHARGGLGLRLQPRWRMLASLGFEKNHLFKLDTRAAVYVTHFYY